MAKIPRRKSKKPPSKPHQGNLPSNMASDGHILDAAEMAARAERWKKAGLCQTCGQVQTHKIIFGIKRIAQTIQGQCYEGKCLRCQTLTTARLNMTRPVDAAEDFMNVARYSTAQAPVSTVSDMHPDRAYHSDASHLRRSGNPSMGSGGRSNMSPIPQMHQVAFDASNNARQNANGQGNYFPTRGPSYGDNNGRERLGDNENMYHGGEMPAENGRQDYFGTLNNQAEAANQIPLNVGPKIGEMQDDVSLCDMSVISELTLDPSLRAPAPRTSSNQESLGQIAEESGSNDIGSSQTQDNDNNSASMSYNRSLSGTNSASPPQVGAVSVKSGDRIYERKMRENERRHSGNSSNASRTNRNSGNSQGAPSADAGHVRFENEDQGGMMTAKDLQDTRSDASWEARTQQETQRSDFERMRSNSNSGSGRSRSDGDATSTGAGSDGFARLEERIRRKTEEHDQASKRSSSGDLNKTDKAAPVDGNVNDGNAPGAHHVSDSEPYITLLDRKNKEAKLQHRRATTETISESDAKTMIAESHTCSDVLDVLKNTSTQPAIIAALNKLCDCLVSGHGLADGAGQISLSMDSMDVSARSKLPNAGWAKIMMMVMGSHSSAVVIQSKLLFTLWTIVTLQPRYTNDLTSSSDMEKIITSMEMHAKDEKVQEYGCGLIATIAVTDKHALRLMGLCNGKFIQRLMMALNFKGNSGNVQGNVLKALFRLSSASLSEDSPKDFFAKRMGDLLDSTDQSGDPAVNAIVAVQNAMKDYIKNLSVQIYGFRLLWSIFSPEAVQDPDYVDILVGKTLERLKNAMQFHKKSQALHETVVCLLTKISSFESVNSHTQSTFPYIAVDIMKAFPKSGVVAKHGCRCLATACAMPSSQEFNGEIIIGEIIQCMEIFNEHITVQSEACAALSAMCINSPSNKEKVQQEGGIDRIKKAFDSCSMNPHEDPFLTTEIRACTALTTLAVDPIALSDIKDKGIIIKFERLVEEDSSMPARLRGAIQGLLDLDEEDSEQSLVFREFSSEDETCHCIRANLRVITTPDFTPNRVSYLRSNVRRGMEDNPSSVSIHQNGCKLLASVYAFETSELTSQDKDLIAELKTISKSLSNHMNNPKNAAAACSALQNCLILLLKSQISDQGLSHMLTSSKELVVNTVVIHHKDVDIMEQATGALQALCAMREGLALSFETETESTIGFLIEAMHANPESFKLQTHGIAILGYFFFVSKEGSNFISDQLVAILMRFIQKEVDNEGSADLINTAVNLVRIVTKKFQGVTIILRHERLIDNVVCCMLRFPETLSIQGACIDILSNIALDNYIRADICQRGGTSRIISALQSLNHDAQLVCKAFAALSNLTSGADIQILRSPDAPAPAVMVSAMRAHPQNLAVQIGAAYAIWALSARNDSFKDEIVNLGGAEAIADAMARFVGSKHMQDKGFVSIWSLAVPRPLKMRVGRCAIMPAVNGMSAHINSERICEQALGCLKCLSTIPVNKGLLEDAGAVDVIYSCKYSKYQEKKTCYYSGFALMVSFCASLLYPSIYPRHVASFEQCHSL